MLKFTGNSWTVGTYLFQEFADRDTGRLAYGYGFDGADLGNTFYRSLEEAMAEAIAEKLTGTMPQAFGPGVGSAAQWFLAACKGAAN